MKNFKSNPNRQIKVFKILQFECVRTQCEPKLFDHALLNFPFVLIAAQSDSQKKFFCRRRLFLNGRQGSEETPLEALCPGLLAEETMGKVEVNKISKKDVQTNTQSCPNCLTDNHLDGSHFCHKCGQELHHG